MERVMGIERGRPAHSVRASRFAPDALLIRSGAPLASSLCPRAPGVVASIRSDGNHGAGDGARTHDIQLGKLTFYR